MRLGLVITDERFAPQVSGLAKAALERGWQVRCFLTDSGVRGLADPDFRALVESGEAWTAVCELSIERYAEGLDAEALGDHIIIGGQYQDAELVRESDKVLVF